MKPCSRRLLSNWTTSLQGKDWYSLRCTTTQSCKELRLSLLPKTALQSWQWVKVCQALNCFLTKALEQRLIRVSITRAKLEIKKKMHSTEALNSMKNLMVSCSLINSYLGIRVLHLIVNWEMLINLFKIRA